jgi:hypothetical protein
MFHEISLNHKKMRHRVHLMAQQSRTFSIAYASYSRAKITTSLPFYLSHIKNLCFELAIEYSC